MNYKIIKVHKNDIKAGDTILHDDNIKTVTSTNIKYSEFMGTSIFGDSYNLGYKLVKKVIFIKN